jgi:hypothetical protein
VARRATVEVGFAAAFDPRPEECLLWPQVCQLGGHDFPAALDYAGTDMYPDVFGPPMTIERLSGAVGLVLQVFRERVLEVYAHGSPPFSAAVRRLKAHADVLHATVEPEGVL